MLMQTGQPDRFALNPYQVKENEWTKPPRMRKRVSEYGFNVSPKKQVIGHCMYRKKCKKLAEIKRISINNLSLCEKER